MDKASFYAWKAADQARTAVRLGNKYYIALALNTVFLAYIYGHITGEERRAASALIHKFGRINGVDYV